MGSFDHETQRAPPAAGPRAVERSLGDRSTDKPPPAALRWALSDAFTRGREMYFRRGRYEDEARYADEEIQAQKSETGRRAPATDPSRVRIHADGEADALAGDLGVAAFTRGRDIYFRRGISPRTALGSRVLAHELTHVAQQERSGVAAIQCYPGVVPTGQNVQAETDAESDQRAMVLLEAQPGYIPLNDAVRWGGLTGWRARLPRSYAEMRRRAATQYSEPAIALLESHDAEVLALVSKSVAVQTRLLEQREYFAGMGEESEAAQAVIDFYGGATYVWGHEDVRGAYEVSYAYFAEQYSDDVRFDLRLYQQIMAGDVEELAQSVGLQAFSAASDARAVREQRQRWSAAGAELVGNEVAKREGLFFDDSLALETLLDPTYGSTDEGQMIAIARLATHMCAVVRVDDRYYTYTLSHDFDRQDIFLSRDWDQASELVEAGAGPPARVISTSDGFLVRRDYVSGRFFGGDQVRAEAAMTHLEADTQLVDSGDAARFGLSPMALFMSMVRNLALVNLAEAEQRMHGIVGQMAPEGLMDPSRGEALQRDTARLRDLTMQADRLAEEIGDNAPTDEQSAERDDLLAEMGELVQSNPAAAFFVSRESPWWAGGLGAISPVAPAAASAAGLAQPVVTDELEGMLGGDAASRAMEEARDRLDNIAKVRRALFDDPDVVLGFEPLHEAVLAHFSAGDRLLIRATLVSHDLKQTAKTIGLAVVDLGLLIGGFFTGGATWVGLGAEAVGTGLGLYQLDAQIRQAGMLAAMSHLDVRGGFEMASEEQAASARRWAIFGAALTFLGVVGLARSASRLIRATEEEAGLVGRIATRAGVSSETAALALRRTWRGLPNPDPDALRELLLAGLPSAMRDRYARLPITVLNEEAWAARFGANSAEHAATSFGTRASGELYPTEVVFRAQGNVFAMEHEAAHILQATDPLFSGRMRQLAALSVGEWARMSTMARLQTLHTVLELELDGQERLLARAQGAGDVEAMEDLFAEMEDIHVQMNDVDRALREGGSPAWFDESRAPTYLFGGPRLPRSRGQWSGVEGNSIWTSTRPQVQALAPNGVRFRNGYPDFRPWQVGGEVRIGQTGFASDFAEADLRYAQRIARGDEAVPQGYSISDFMHNNEAIAAGTERYRRAAGLTWHHHQGGTVMYLVPTRLHANVPHTGGAAAARAAGP